MADQQQQPDPQEGGAKGAQQGDNAKSRRDRPGGRPDQGGSHDRNG